MTDFYKEMPKSVRVGCYEFCIEIGEIEDHESAREFGHVNLANQKIRIRPNMRPHNLANTFIHEVLHAIHWVYGLYSGKPDEETYTTQGANGLCAFWQDNPEAVAWWGEVLQMRFSK